MNPPTFTQPKPRPNYWSWLFLAVAITAINSVLTQTLARQFGYQSALGQPLFGHWYNPFAWNIWQFQYYNHAKNWFNQADVVSMTAYVLILLTAALYQGFTNRRVQTHAGLHGTAHWASLDEIRQTGLLPKRNKPGSGVYVGAWTNQQGQIQYLRHDGPEHIAAIAPTRSGKGVGLVIPTLLSWPDSAVIHDMKGELWALTAGWRQQEAHNKVLKFDPAAASGSCRFNPLAEVRLNSDFEVADVQNLVTIIVDPDGKGLNDHWTKTAHAFLTGVTLHLLYLKQAEEKLPASLYDVAMALSDPNREINALYQEMMDTQHKQGETHPVVAAAARDMLNRPETERGSVLSSAMSYLSLYRDPLVAANIKKSDFEIRDLMHQDSPVSLYLVVRPADKDRLKPLMRLLLNQIVRTLTPVRKCNLRTGNPFKPTNTAFCSCWMSFPPLAAWKCFKKLWPSLQATASKRI